MHWFKHYSNASEGLSLKTLWSNKDYEAIAVFWRLCELLSKHDSKDGILITSWAFIGRETGMKPSKCRRVLARISAVSLLRYEHETDEIQEFLVPKWSEFQETRGKKKSKKNEIVPGDIRSKKKEVRYKKQNIETEVCVEPKQVLVATPTVNKNDLAFFINQKLLELYPQEYLDREKVKMELWIANNQHKKPKSDRGMVRFVTSWLSRGWDQYRKGLQTNAPTEKSWIELLKEDERKLPDGN